jgi:hypothetical protein
VGSNTENFNSFVFVGNHIRENALESPGLFDIGTGAQNPKADHFNEVDGYDAIIKNTSQTLPCDGNESFSLVPDCTITGIIENESNDNEHFDLFIESAPQNDIVQLITDKDELEILTELFNESTIHETVGMVEYKGKFMKPECALMMKHVVNKMKDHFGSETEPRVGFFVKELTNLGYDEQYKSKNNPSGDRWYSEVKMKYTLPSGPHNFDIVAFDNIYFDMIPKTSKSGMVAKNYGKTWINVYLPSKTVRAFLKSFKDSTGWGVSSRVSTKDEEQDLVSISANIDEEEPPRFYYVMQVLDADDKPVGSVQIQDGGSVQAVCQDPDYQTIYRGTGFFNLSMNVITGVNSTTAPEPSVTTSCRLKFNLLNAPVFAAAENVNPVRLGLTSSSKKNF